MSAEFFLYIYCDVTIYIYSCCYGVDEWRSAHGSWAHCCVLGDKKAVRKTGATIIAETSGDAKCLILSFHFTAYLLTQCFLILSCPMFLAPLTIK